MPSLPVLLPAAAIASGALAAAWALAVLVVALVAYRAMLRKPPCSEDYIRASSLEKGEFSEAELALPWEEAEVAAPGGYRLAVRGLRGSRPRLAVFHHGITWNWMGALKYARAFRRAGWSVVAFDSRGHGRSGGGRPSFGYFEKGDLSAVLDWALARYPAEEGLLLHGESLGAASVIQCAARDSRPDAVVADCPFSSMRAELLHQLAKTGVPAIVARPAAALVRRLVLRLDGFDMREAAPERAALDFDAPLLLVHGKEDDYVPWSMSVAMAESRRAARPGAATELVLVEGARHAKSWLTDPEAYERLVLNFAERAFARSAPAPAARAPAASSPGAE